MNVKEDIKVVTCFGQMSAMDIQPTAVKDTQSQSTTDYFLITIGKGIFIMKKSNRPGLDHMIKLNMTNNETLTSLVSIGTRYSYLNKRSALSLIWGSQSNPN